MRKNFNLFTTLVIITMFLTDADCFQKEYNEIIQLIPI